MKKITVVLSAIVVALGAWAGVPVKWTVETSRADVQEVPCYHGETLEMEATLKNYGKDLLMPTNLDAQIFWQTNGMSVFYWRTNNVTIVSNKLVATFTPEMDPGTSSCKGFIGVPGEIYRASFVLRFKNSPGLEPRSMEWPYRELDFDQIEMKNEKWYRKEASDAKYETAEGAQQKADAAYRNATNDAIQAGSGVYKTKSTQYASYNTPSNVITGIRMNANGEISWLRWELIQLHKSQIVDFPEIPSSEEFVKWTETGYGEPALTIGTRDAGIIGEHSLAQGVDVKATAKSSHAEGEETEASAENAHAEGEYTEASAEASHAEGYRAKASEIYAHAEGYETTASGEAAHAEGILAVAEGEYSHAEGNNTVANGKGAHAEGKETRASGSYAHAEGDTTTASGDYAHAEGSNAAASGNYAHAEGNGTTASGAFSHAEGDNTTASGDYAHAEGSNAAAEHNYSYVWQGEGENWVETYSDHGAGTYNIKPVGDLDGFYIGETNLTTILNRYEKKGKSGTSTNAVDALIKSYDQTNITARIGAVATKANATSNKVEFIEGYMAGQRVRVSVTNYYGNTSGALPRLRIEEYVTATNMVGGVATETNYWTTVWDENNKYHEWLTEARSAIAAMTNNLYQTYYQLLQARLATKAPKAWGTVTSAGEAAPPGTVWNTEPTTVFAGGTEYAHAMVGSGVIGVLTAKGASIYTAGATGKFRFTTDDEASYFGMDIANRYELGCATDGIEVTLVGGNNLVELTYNVTMTGKPILYYRKTLASTNTWEQITNSSGEPVSGASVYASWEQSPPSGTEICTINGGANLTGFFMATIEYPSSAKFETNMPSDLKGGILATNQTLNVIQPVEPYISNGSVLWRIKQ